MLRKNLVALVAAAVVGASGIAMAQGTPHKPQIHQEWNADHFLFSYDDGVCHMSYEYDFKSGNMNLDKHGDCSNVEIPSH